MNLSASIYLAPHVEAVKVSKAARSRRRMKRPQINNRSPAGECNINQTTGQTEEEICLMNISAADGNELESSGQIYSHPCFIVPAACVYSLRSAESMIYSRKSMGSFEIHSPIYSNCAASTRLPKSICIFKKKSKWSYF